MANRVDYKRLKAGGGPMFTLTASPQSLYLGPDHLMILQTSGFAEQARRFYFSEIEAITCLRTASWAITSFILLAIAIAFGVLSLGPFGGDEIGRAMQLYFGIIGATITLILLAVNLIKGPTCVTTLHTAVHQEKFNCLRRLRAAQNAIHTLTPLIIAAQGPLDTGAAVAHLNVNTQDGTPVLKTARRAMPVKIHESRPELLPYDGTQHTAFFTLLFLIVLSCCIDFFVDNDIKNFMDSILYLATIGVGILALIKHRHSQLDYAVRKATAVSFSVLVVSTYLLVNMLNYQQGFMLGFMAAQNVPVQENISYGPLHKILAGIDVALFLPCCLWGMLALFQNRPVVARHPANTA